MNRRRPALLGLMLVAALAAPSIAQTPPASAPGVPAPTPTPLPQPTQVPQIGPSQPPAAATTAAPSPAALPSPVVTPAPLAAPATPLPWGFVFQPPHAPPAAPQTAGAPVILEFDLNAEPIVAPSDVRGRILTNPEVVNVTVRMFGRETSIPKVAPGDFELAGHVPSIPFFMSAFVRGRRDIEIVAAVADGRTVSITVPVRIQ